ncbi:MAG: FtsX-like permease family protein [Anaerocolumna sp.]
MRYSLKRVWLQLKCNWKIYTVISLEYAVGIVVLVSCMNVFYSSKDTIREYKSRMTSDTIPITYTGEPELGESSSFPIPYENYLDLSEKYSNDLRMSFTLQCSTTYYIKNSDTFLTLYILFMNDNMFYDWFGYERKDNVVYVGSTANESIQNLIDELKKDPLNKNIKCFDEEFLSFSNDKITLSGNIGYHEELLQGKKGTEYIPSSSGDLSEDIPISSCVIFPLDSVTQIKNVHLSAPKSLLNVNYVNEIVSDDILSALIMDLSSSQKGYQFSIADQFLEFQNSIEDLNARYETFFLMACAVLCIVINGIIGILLIFLYRRKKSMAISIAYGATFGRIVRELFLEILFVLLSGCVLGLIGAYFCNAYINLSHTIITFHPLCILWVIGVSSISGFITCSLALIGIKREVPIQVLRDL